MTEFGLYDIALNIDGGVGCARDTLAKNALTVLDFELDFKNLKDTFCLSDRILFSSQGTPANQFLWEFGDGGTSTKRTVSHQYSDTGNYNVCVTAIKDGGICQRKICKPLHIENPVAVAASDVTVSCKLPLTVNFTAQGSTFSNGSRFTWIIDGDPYPGKDVSFTFDRYGTFQSLLTLTTNAGCKAYSASNVEIKPISLQIGVNNPRGCAPLSRKFKDISDYASQELEKREWFVFSSEDKINPIYSELSTNKDSLLYTFNDVGDFLVGMYSKTKSGCSDTAFVIVEAGVAPILDFNVLPNDSCSNSTFLFVDSSYVLNNGVKDYDLVDSRQWIHPEPGAGTEVGNLKYLDFYRTGHDTLNGVLQGSSTGTHKTYDITLIAGYNGCNDTLVKKSELEIHGPVCNLLSFRQNCDEDTLRVFGTMFAWTKRIWRIDDQGEEDKDTVIVDFFPSYQNTTFNGLPVNAASHSQSLPSTDALKVYAPQGFKGMITLELYNDAYSGWDSCRLERILFVNTAPSANFSLPKKMCLNPETGSNELELVTSNFTGSTEWSVRKDGGDKKVLGKGVASIKYTPVEPGTYEFTFAYALNSPCPRFVSKSIDIVVPEVEIVVEGGDLGGCSALIVDLIGASTGTDVIEKWTWEILEISNPQNPTLIKTFDGQDPPPHNFSQAGTYFYKLEARNDLGCLTEASLGKVINLDNPKAEFEISKTKLCEGDSLHVTNLSSYFEPLNYQWFINGILQASDSIPVLFVPSADSADIMFVASAGLCTDTFKIEDALEIDRHAVFDFNADQTNINCPPLSTRFYPTFSANPSGSSDFFWDIGIGTSLLDTTFGFYDFPGKYDVSLVVTSPHGCKDTLLKEDYIVIDGPKADSITFEGARICANDTFRLTVHGSQNIEEYRWTFGDGNAQLVMGPTNTVDYAYTTLFPDTIVAKVLMINGNCSVLYEKPLKLSELSAEITALPKDSLCGIPQDLSFYVDQTETGLGYQWSFDESQKQADSNFLFVNPGLHKAYLHIADSNSTCTKTDSVSFTIFENPQANVSPSYVHCQGDSVSISLSGADNYSWTPPVGIKDISSNQNFSEVYASANTTTRYRVDAYDATTKCLASYETIVYADSTNVDFLLNLQDQCLDGVARINYPSSRNIVGDNFLWTIVKWTDTLSFNNPISSFYVDSPDTVYFALKLWDKDEKCAQIKLDTAVVYPLPEVAIELPKSPFCNYDSLQISASGGVSYQWKPEKYLNDAFIAQPYCAPDFTTSYEVEVTDEQGCSNKDSVLIEVVPEYIFVDSIFSDSIFVGDFIELEFAVGDSLTFAPYDVISQWTPGYALQCDDCFYNNAQPLKTTQYTITTIDEFGCYPKSIAFTIEVEEKYQIDVPTGFSPNGDDNNELVYLRGIGVKELLDFSIYNRWGELLFKTTDINQGWDGTYNGLVQNDENYVYQASVLYYNGTVENKKGFITILK